MCTAPEVLRGLENINYKQADVYQLGMICYHIFYKEEPLTNLPLPNSGRQ